MLKRITLLTLAMLMLFSMSASAFTIDGGTYVEALKALQVNIPSIMYHKITDNPAEVTDFVVTGEMLAADFAEINSRGYTPITASEFFRIRKLTENLFNNEAYKEVAEFYKKYPKPIIITFDDGYKGIYTYALPLMRQYNFKANFYICGELIDNQNSEYCTWEEIKALSDSGLAEIGNHTYSLHNKSKEEIGTFYNSRFQEALADINLNREKITSATGVDCKVISFPYGQYDYNIVANLKTAGYEMLISTDYKVNRYNEKTKTIGRFNRPASFTTKEFFDMVDMKCKIY